MAAHLFTSSAEVLAHARGILARGEWPASTMSMTFRVLLPTEAGPVVIERTVDRDGEIVLVDDAPVLTLAEWAQEVLVEASLLDELRAKLSA